MLLSGKKRPPHLRNLQNLRGFTLANHQGGGEEKGIQVDGSNNWPVYKHPRGGKGVGGSPYTGHLITGLPIIGFVYTYPGHSSMKIRGVLTVLSIPFIDRGEEEKRKADGFNN